MTKSKLRRVLGWQSRSSGVLGWQNRSSGASWGRKTEPQASFRVGLLLVWGDSGRALGVRGVRGGPPRNFRVDFVFLSFPCRKSYETLSNKSFPPNSDETGDKYFQKQFYKDRLFWKLFILRLLELTFLNR